MRSHGSGITIAARRYVIACGGIETPRLLLASNDVHPAGVGNGHDLVGRFFMDHPHTGRRGGDPGLAPGPPAPLYARPRRHGQHLLGGTDNSPVPRAPRRGRHHISTARMSDDPRRGVTDGHGRVRGLPDLYIAGSALFPTCGGSANPTLTLVA